MSISCCVLTSALILCYTRLFVCKGLFSVDHAFAHNVDLFSSTQRSVQLNPKSTVLRIMNLRLVIFSGLNVCISIFSSLLVLLQRFVAGWCVSSYVWELSFLLYGLFRREKAIWEVAISRQIFSFPGECALTCSTWIILAKFCNQTQVQVKSGFNPIYCFKVWCRRGSG